MSGSVRDGGFGVAGKAPGKAPGKALGKVPGKAPGKVPGKVKQAWVFKPTLK